MRRCVPFVAFLLCVVLLASCAADSRVLYQNFLDDMDVVSRSADALADVKNGNTNYFVYAQINTLIYDLKLMDIQDTTVKYVNDQYIAGLQQLNDVVKNKPEKAVYDYKVAYAQKAFNEAYGVFQRYKKHDLYE